MHLPLIIICFQYRSSYSIGGGRGRGRGRGRCSNFSIFVNIYTFNDIHLLCVWEIRREKKNRKRINQREEKGQKNILYHTFGSLRGKMMLLSSLCL